MSMYIRLNLKYNEELRNINLLFYLKETLENQHHSRDNGPVIADQDPPVSVELSPL
jgi:hypothetical protein